MKKTPYVKATTSGTFAGLVIGLAGTTVLSNIMAGILIILARPFQVSDRITITTYWAV